MELREICVGNLTNGTNAGGWNWNLNNGVGNSRWNNGARQFSANIEGEYPYPQRPLPLEKISRAKAC